VICGVRGIEPDNTGHRTMPFTAATFIALAVAQIVCTPPAIAQVTCTNPPCVFSYGGVSSGVDPNGYWVDVVAQLNGQGNCGNIGITNSS
jgi:hypothetical protein